MDGLDRPGDRKVKRERDALRQKLCRRRKKAKGKYVHLFVPHAVAARIKGNPSRLVQRFVELSEVMDRMEQQEKEIHGLTQALVTKGLTLHKRLVVQALREQFAGHPPGGLRAVVGLYVDDLNKELAEERNEFARFKRRASLFANAADALIKVLTGKSEEYLQAIHTIEEALSNPRLKYEWVRESTLNRIRTLCKSTTEQSAATREKNRAAHHRLLHDWLPA
jgi:hypothetical protein